MKSREYIVDESGLTLMIEMVGGGKDTMDVKFRILNTFSFNERGEIQMSEVKLPRDAKVTKFTD